MSLPSKWSSQMWWQWLPGRTPSLLSHERGCSRSPKNSRLACEGQMKNLQWEYIRHSCQDSAKHKLEKGNGQRFIKTSNTFTNCLIEFYFKKHNECFATFWNMNYHMMPLTFVSLLFYCLLIWHQYHLLLFSCPLPPLILPPPGRTGPSAPLVVLLLLMYILPGVNFTFSWAKHFSKSWIHAFGKADIC